jgi:dihydrofolate synthase/folylpolyglutamate synthase
MPGRQLKTFSAFQKLDRKLGQPHRAFRSVHIGGTNGKGSVSQKIYEALQAEGFCVGLYTSPHITSVYERIQVDGAPIPEEAFQRHLAKVAAAAVDTHSFFDFMTAIALLHFFDAHVDWAVIEVGLGGRLDATNVIDPKLAIITSIGFDHMEILGDTLEKIAREKAGIAKPNVPLIVGPSAAPFFPQAIGSKRAPGFYDFENSALAALALRHLGVSERAIEMGIRARPPCRFEIVGNTVLDVAHNQDGFEKLIEALLHHFPNEKFHFIVAFSKGKDWQSCLKLIAPHASKISFVDSHPRFVPFGGGTLEDALGASDARQVIAGSFYLMDEARSKLGLGSGAG